MFHEEFSFYLIFRIVRNKAAENAKQSPGHTSPSVDTGSPPLSHQPSPNSEIQRAPYTITGILGIPQSQTAQTMVDPNGNKRKREDQGKYIRAPFRFQILADFVDGTQFCSTIEHLDVSKRHYGSKSG